MKLPAVIALLLSLLACNAIAQQLSSEEKTILAAARSRYYNLESRGFESVTCRIDFDFSTVPQLPSSNPDADIVLLKHSVFTLYLPGTNRDQVNVSMTYPDGTSDQAIQRTSQLSGVLRAIAQGTFMTWGTKGLHGPIPAFNSEIRSVVRNQTGYTVILNYPGDPVRIELDEDYLVKAIVSIGGKINEKPTYSSTPDGWVFSGNDAIDNSGPNGQVHVKYELMPDIIDGLRLPVAGHVKVEQNIDTRFALHNCSVKKTIVLEVAPPPAQPKS